MIDHLSYSGFSTWKECGEKYRLTRQVKVPESPGWALIGGSAVHSASEAIDFKMMGVDTGKPETFLAAFDAEIEKTLNNSVYPMEEWRVSGKASKDWPLKETKEWWIWHGTGFVQSYVDWRNRFNGTIWITPDGAPAIELEVNADLGDARVLGYIDRIFECADGSLKIVDLKAGRTTPTDGLQLGVYGIGLPNSWVRPTTGSYFMARDGILVGNYDLIAMRSRIQYEFGQAWRDINAGSFLPRETYMCKFCSVRDFCWAKDGEYSEAVKPF